MYEEAKIVSLTLDIGNCVSEHKLLRVLSVEIRGSSTVRVIVFERYCTYNRL